MSAVIARHRGQLSHGSLHQSSPSHDRCGFQPFGPKDSTGQQPPGSKTRLRSKRRSRVHATSTAPCRPSATVLGSSHLRIERPTPRRALRIDTPIHATPPPVCDRRVRCRVHGRDEVTHRFEVPLTQRAIRLHHQNQGDGELGGMADAGPSTVVVSSCSRRPHEGSPNCARGLLGTSPHGESAVCPGRLGRRDGRCDRFARRPFAAAIHARASARS